jgi:hypothetical protein
MRLPDSFDECNRVSLFRANNKLPNKVATIEKLASQLGDVFGLLGFVVPRVGQKVRAIGVKQKTNMYTEDY